MLIIVMELLRIRHKRRDELSGLRTLVISKGLHRGGPPAEMNVGGGKGEEEQDHRHEGQEAAEVTETPNPVQGTATRTVYKGPRTGNRRCSSYKVRRPASTRVGARPFSGWSPTGRCPHNTGDSSCSRLLFLSSGFFPCHPTSCRGSQEVRSTSVSSRLCSVSHHRTLRSLSGLWAQPTQLIGSTNHLHEPAVQTHGWASSPLEAAPLHKQPLTGVGRAALKDTQKNTL